MTFARDPHPPAMPCESPAAGGGGAGSRRDAIPSVTMGIDRQGLLGRPHLVGRVKGLRDGFSIEPIGTMTQSPGNRDETVAGADHASGTHDAMEYGTLYEAPLRWRSDDCFLLHDTNVMHAPRNAANSSTRSTRASRACGARARRSGATSSSMRDP